MRKVIQKVIVIAAIATLFAGSNEKVFGQILPGGGGGGSGTNEPYNWTPLPYVPGLKMNISMMDATNFRLTLLEADPAGKYDIYFATNLISATWNDLLQGTNGQSNFALTFPNSSSGFFRTARTDTPVADAGNMTFYFPYESVNTNIVNAIVEGGPAAATAILVDSTNFAGATWIPFSLVPLVDIGTNEGTHEVWFGFQGTNGVVYWSEASVTLDTTPPVLVITNPVSTTTSRPIIQLQGYGLEPLSHIYFDVTNAAGSVTNQQGFVTEQSFDTNKLNFTTNWFQCFDIELTNGVNTITVHAADLAGNVATTNVTITLDFTGDTNPPVATVTWPEDGAQISGTNFTLRGVLDDETAQITAQMVDTNGVTNIVNGVVERNGTFWLEDLPLNSGTNIVTITATDAAGNASVTNLTLFQSDVTLTIDLVSDDQLNQSVTTVSGTVSDPSYDVWINGVQATVDGSGHWTTNNVPVYGNGTATFDAIAYPPGQSPNLRMQMNSNSGQSPVQTSQAREQPPTVFISSYSDQWKEEMTCLGGGGPYLVSWGASKNYTASIDNSGRLSYQANGTFFYHEDNDIGWWDTSYDWSSSDPVGTYTKTGYDPDADDYSGTGCGDFWNPDPYDVPSWSWGCGSHYYANINYDMKQQCCFDAVDVTYSRSSKTSMKLRTGGKSGIAHKNLLAISASATEYGRPDGVCWGNGPEEWENTPEQGIAPNRIQVLGKTLGNDGSLYIVLPDNATVDLGASAPASHYSLGVSATKYHPYITANGTNLDTTTPEFCVGQSVTFALNGLPSCEDCVSHWTLPDKYVNEVYQYSSSCTSYRVNNALLNNPTTSCWYVNGSGGAVNVGQNLQFPSGQVTIVAKGNFTIYRPTISNFQPRPPFFAALIPSNSPSTLRLGDDNENGAMAYTLDVNSVQPFSGNANIVQLVNASRAVSAPYGGQQSTTAGQFWLDNQEFYIGGNNPVNPPSIPYAYLEFTDMPGYGLNPITGSDLCSIVDYFKDYVVFKPDGNGNIYVTLGLISWDWSASASKVDGVWTIPAYQVNGPSSPDGSDEFPTWPQTYHNGLP